MIEIDVVILDRVVTGSGLRYSSEVLTDRRIGKIESGKIVESEWILARCVAAVKHAAQLILSGRSAREDAAAAAAGFRSALRPLDAQIAALWNEGPGILDFVEVLGEIDRQASRIFLQVPFRVMQ